MQVVERGRWMGMKAKGIRKCVASVQPGRGLRASRYLHVALPPAPAAPAVDADSNANALIVQLQDGQIADPEKMMQVSVTRKARPWSVGRPSRTAAVVAPDVVVDAALARLRKAGKCMLHW